MFKPTQPLLRAIRRLALTTKQAPKAGGYYKGTRTGSMGWHTKWGGYIIDRRKVRTFVVPENLHLFTLTPFVGEYIHAPKRSLKGKNGGIDGEVYLRLWKDNGGQE